MRPSVTLALALSLMACSPGAAANVEILADGTVRATAEEGAVAGELLLISPSGSEAVVARIGPEGAALNPVGGEGGTWAAVVVAEGGWDGTLAGLLSPAGAPTLHRVEADGVHVIPPDGDVRAAVIGGVEHALVGDIPHLTYLSPGAAGGQVAVVAVDAERRSATFVRAAHTGGGSHPFTLEPAGTGPWTVVVLDGGRPVVFRLSGPSGE